MIMKKGKLVVFLVIAVLGHVHLYASLGDEKKAASQRPNILLIVADDMGYSDLGCYGSEIHTPQLDKLAQNGIRFTAFCNTSRCWPSRSALMTGYYPQQFNMDPIAKHHPHWVTYIPNRLKMSGYRCYQSGKWHVQSAPRLITDAGYDQSYEILDHNRHFAVQVRKRNDKKLPPVKKGTNYYSTTDIADETIRQLKEHAVNTPDQPFFAYTAFIAPHFPLMAPQKDIDHYKNVYQCGWDILREKRYNKMKELGIYNGELSQREEQIGPPYRFPDVPGELGNGEVLFPVAWNSLSQEQKKFQAAKMSIHAAMVDRMDQEIGRIIQQLKEMKKLDNTIIFFLSDNGASAEIMIRGDRHNPEAIAGGPESFLCLGPGFSNAANTPFRRHKTWVHEGGISTPLIVYGPGYFNGHNRITNQPGHLVDLAPTILELAGTEFPNVKKYPGISLVPVLKGTNNRPHPPIYFSHEGNKALKTEHWKIVLAKADQKAGEPEKWELYDLEKDRAERHNLAERYPNRVQQMSEIWEKMDRQFRNDAK